MDETASPRLPLQILFVLVVCAFSMLVHFVAGGLTPADESHGVVLAVQGVNAHLFDEDRNDNFIFPIQARLPVERSDAALQCAVATCADSFLISPLIPPPNS